MILGECAVLESVKAASDIYAPASGEVVEVNKTLEEDAELINRSAEDEGEFAQLLYKSSRTLLVSDHSTTHLKCRSPSDLLICSSQNLDNFFSVVSLSFSWPNQLHQSQYIHCAIWCQIVVDGHGPLTIRLTKYLHHNTFLCIDNHMKCIGVLGGIWFEPQEFHKITNQVDLQQISCAVFVL